ncbi:MAG: hypothetical protein JWP69_1740 [Flaviaesturariibacter sp.]|nr:hypothetical protein [Flaviaesturariibacter sp.]
MKIKSQIIAWLLIVLFIACTSKVSNRKGNPIPGFSGKVFSFSPFLDSAAYKGEAPCDCCTSNLAFYKDSSFIFISYCLEGDNFSKGKFSVQEKDLLLHFDSVEVIQSFGFVADTSYEVHKVVPKTAALQISNVKSKPLLLLKNDNGLIEYGVEDTTTTLYHINKKVKIDSIWRILNPQEHE